MANRSPRTNVVPPFSRAPNDEGSHVRERRPTTPPVGVRKPDPGSSLDQRLVSKLAEASALLARLEPQDSRARLLHIAMLRRDEALLDGILVELSAPRSARRPR